MKFDYQKIEEKLRTFWRENKMEMHYFICGKEVIPERISSCSFQIIEIEASDSYNFQASALNLRVQIDSMEAIYKADFLIKVIPSTTSEDEIPEEEIAGIYNNRINLRN